ncbi:hypothetical protein CANARDRAFT_28172 [[Candida] arabinofermentans NRRL YB-2248]|uniref:MIF4G domain-containing protein n=1 Tax=[Candida] arabinofermentans NRRL YB-2248 TaxID=983967 RepID=A0A1E4T0S7_9ASCO|nr:hypothetical protein CANARDRAFT_28172 [[Candida] arabinofermentans NRRL YB-2248]
MSIDFEIRRKQLLDLNGQAWDGNNQVFKTRALDTSLKKNTAFIKKIRTSITKENEKSLIDGIATTSLEKYMHELLSATSEGLTKVVKVIDTQASIEIISALHQRFSVQFTPYLMLFFVHAIQNPKVGPDDEFKDPNVDKDEKERLTRQRILIKLFMEFYLVGIFRSIDDMPKSELPLYLSKKSNSNSNSEPLIVSVVREVMMFEINRGGSAQNVASFLKRFATPFILNSNDFITEFARESLKSLIVNYTKKMAHNAENCHKEIQYQTAKSKTISMKTGKIVEGIEETIEHLKLKFERLNNYCEYACELLGVAKPNLSKEVELDDDSNTTKITVVNDNNKDTNPYWDNEEMRKFYQEIFDVSTVVPMDDNTTADADPTAGTKMAILLSRLDEAETSKDVDDIVCEFWSSNLNNKSSRQRIWKHFIETKEISPLKNYARFLKINEKYFENIKDDLIEFLDKGFRSQIHTNRIDFKNVHFFSELVKFKLVPIYVLFHKIRSLILNVEVSNNIDILSLLFEDCGKLLLKHPDYKEHTEEMIDLLKGMKNKSGLSINEKQAINIFLITINPPSIKALGSYSKQLTIDEKFMNQLVKKELNNKTWTLVAKYLLMMDWNKKDVFDRLKKILTRPDKVNYENIPNLALIFNQLVKEDKRLLVFVVDDLMEQFSIGLEYNLFKYNRIRMAQIRYLVELSNLKLIKPDIVMNLLYKTVCFGHPDNSPSRQSKNCELDPPDDYFRIQMICLFLTNLKLDYFSKKNLVNLEVFYRFFDYYIWTKTQPLPMETNFRVIQLFSGLSVDGKSYERAKSYEESIDSLQKAMMEQGYKVNEGEEEEEEDDEDEEEEEEEEEGTLVGEDEVSVGGMVDSEDESGEESDDDNSTDDEDGSEEDEDDSDETDEEETDEEETDEEDSDDEEDEEEDTSLISEELYERKLNEQLEMELEKELRKLRIEGIQASSSALKKVGNNNNNNLNKLFDPSSVNSKNANKDKKTFTFLTKNSGGGGGGSSKNSNKEIKLPENTRFTANYIKAAQQQRRELEIVRSRVLSGVMMSSSSSSFNGAEM